jgi:hypothetical protein
LSVVPALDHSPASNTCKGIFEPVNINALSDGLSNKSNPTNLADERKDTKERPYACFCGRTFTRQDLLKRHGRRAHEACAEGSGSVAAAINDVSQHNTSRSGTITTPAAREIHTSAIPGFHRAEHEADIHGNAPDSLLPDSSIQDTIFAVSNGNTQVENQITPGIDLQASIDTCLGLFDSGNLDLDWGDMDLVETEAQAPMGIQHSSSIVHIDMPMGFGTSFSELQVPTANSGYDTTGSTLDVSEMQTWYQRRMENAIHQHLPPFLMPSHRTIMRYLGGYVEGSNQDLPFIHVPTLSLETCSPELVLAMATIGAYQRFERRNSLELFHASKNIALCKLRTWQDNNDQETEKPTPGGPELYMSDDSSNSSRYTAMESLRALLLLGFYRIWGESPVILKQIVEFQPLMVGVARRYGLAEHSEPHTRTASWSDWVHEESDRRTKFALFCFLNLQTVMHNIPSPILCSEWQLRMPCSAEEWEAETESEWLAKRADTQPILFQDSFRSLLSPVDYSKTELQNSFGFDSTILMLTLLQRIHYVRQLHAATGDTLGEEAIQQLQ